MDNYVAKTFRIKHYHGTKAELEAENKVLLEGEIALEIDNAEMPRMKLGDGIRSYIQLPYIQTEGKSAYQLAVDNGYEGTVGEWLASLEGSIDEGTQQELMKPKNKIIIQDTLHKLGAYDTVQDYSVNPLELIGVPTYYLGVGSNLSKVPANSLAYVSTELLWYYIDEQATIWRIGDIGVI